MEDEIRLRLTDEPSLPEGFVPMINFSVNKDMELRGAYDKEFPEEVIIEVLKQWIESKESSKTHKENQDGD